MSSQPKHFEKVINGIRYIFKPVFYDPDLYYHITTEPKTPEFDTFRMKRDEDGHWKIQAQLLPQYIWDNVFEFGDAIEENK